MITVFANNKQVPVRMVEFSDGAITFKLDELPENPKYISVNVCPTTPVYRIREELRLVVSCIENFYGCVMLQGQPFMTQLNLPYLGYGRADRVFEKGNPSPLYDFLQDIGKFGFSEVNCCDIHNNNNCLDIGGCPNVIEKPQLECFKQSLPHDFNTDYDIVLAPDKGAVLKAQSIAAHLEVDIYNCGKERDISTGKVIKSTLPDIDFTGKVVLIPDDLMDGGYTFIKLAEQLKTAGAKQVDLYVTHMIGAKGLDSLKGLIDNVYCYQTVGKYLNKQDITNFNLNK
ncbi:ribose-phosphate pyrophosphokinase [Shewanella sp. phage 1/40]|uniref:ribose-phosphate pyrophosphokinase n=1 Tax=Shewanella sp. phage 1/40 TaxID=1458860 RepID=UPI0004F6CECC|nr:ribose-phosphate pyrophosphokinase [Shewanella sp. phage 1/40]AHK11507.1 ribose-phosphate pyrophosphokinase [Shewanella sp. phage 1/40]